MDAAMKAPPGTAASIRSLTLGAVLGVEADTKIASKLGLKLESATSRHVFENRAMTVSDYIGKFRKGSINRVFPGEFLDKTVEDALRRGGSDVRKLLTDLRFVK
jgi:hypothetical protein